MKIAGGLALAVRLAEPGVPAPELELTWVAPAECPAPGAVRADVERLLGRPLGPASPSAGTLRAGAVVTRDGQAWEMTLSFASAVGEPSRRRLRDEHCHTLAEVAALFVALAVDPLAVAERENAPTDPLSRPADAVAIPPSPRAPVPTVGPSSPRPPPPVERPVRLSLRALAAVAGFLLPGAAPGFQLGVGLVLRRFRLELAGNYFPDRAARSSAVPGVGLTASLGAAELRAGPRFGFVHGLELTPALSLSAGALSARGFGVTDPRRRVSPWLAAVGGLELGWFPSRRLGATLQVDAVLSILRPSFGIENLGVLHQPAVFGMRALLGLEVRLP